MTDVYNEAVDVLIKFAGTNVADRIFDEIDSSISDDDISFSEKHTQTINKIIYAEKYKLKNAKKKNLNKRILLIATITMTFLLLSILTVWAYREKIVDFFMEISDFGTMFHYESNQEYIIDKVKMMYIPNEFEKSQEYNNDNECFMRYEKEDLFFDVDKQVPPDAYTINTENGNTEYIDINGSTALFSISYDYKILTWIKNGYVYTVSGNVAKEEIILIAKNIS
jgi:hypothetical protein